MKSKPISLIRYAKFKSLDEAHDREVKRVAAELKNQNPTLWAEVREHVAQDDLRTALTQPYCIKCAYLSPPTNTK